MIWQGAGKEAASEALSYLLPRGEEDFYLSRALQTVAPFIVENTAPSRRASV
jgi:hypothetical protein